MKTRYRISKVDKGWIVEHLTFKYNFLGIHFCKVWRPFVTAAGLNSFWYHSTKEFAEMNLIKEVKSQTYGIWEPIIKEL